MKLMETDNFKDQLEDLLSEDRSSVRDRENRTVDLLTDNFKTPIVIFGAGNLGRKILSGLRSLGIHPLAFSDNNPNLWDKVVDNLMVYSPKDAANRFGASSIFMVAVWNPAVNACFQSIQRQLGSLDCHRVIPFGPLLWKYQHIFLPHPYFGIPRTVIEQKEDVFLAMNLMSDSVSRQEYFFQIKLQTYQNHDDPGESCQQEQYFPDNIFTLNKDELFIDYGAFNGDTIKSFLLRQVHFN